MATRRFNALALLFFLLSVALQACAPATAPQDESIFYPSPPEDPRIVYLRSYRGAVDFRKQTWIDRLFGAPADPILRQPYGVFTRGERIYVAPIAGPVVVLDTKEKKVETLGDTGRERIARPMGVAGAPDGMLFVSDVQHKKVFGYDAAGKIKTVIGTKGELVNPVGIAVNHELQRVYVVDSHSHVVRVYSTAGAPLFSFGGPGLGDGQFYYPGNVAVNQKNGKVYVSESQNFRVQVFDRDGKFLLKFGDVGDQPGSFSRPRGVGVDSEGHIYVVDAGFSNFQVFDENGKLMLFVGEPGVESGKFQVPAGIYVDEQDRIYVADSLNSRVQVFQYLSEQWKKEHPEEYKKYLLRP